MWEFDDFSGTQSFFSFFVTALNFSFTSFLLFQDKRKRRSSGEPICVFEYWHLFSVSGLSNNCTIIISDINKFLPITFCQFGNSVGKFVALFGCHAYSETIAMRAWINNTQPLGIAGFARLHSTYCGQRNFFAPPPENTAAAFDNKCLVLYRNRLPCPFPTQIDVQRKQTREHRQDCNCQDNIPQRVSLRRQGNKAVHRHTN